MDRDTIRFKHSAGAVMKVTVVLPAFNEERDLPTLLTRIHKALNHWAEYKVLVVV